MNMIQPYPNCWHYSFKDFLVEATCIKNIVKAYGYDDRFFQANYILGTRNEIDSVYTV